MIPRNYGQQLTLDLFEDGTCQKQTCGALDSHAKISQLQANNKELSEAQEAVSILKSCAYWMKQGKINPNGLSLKMLKILCLLGGGWEFFTVIVEMEKRGYSVEWSVYNSKNYGVPQNRERIYIVGYLGNTGRRKILPTPRAGEKGIRQIGNFINRRKNPQCGRVYDIDGIGPTLRANTGGFSEPYIRVVGQIGKNKQRGRIFANDGIVGALSACDYKDPLKVLDGDRIRKLTPLECWRLQGFSDEQFYKASKVNSNSQLYRQAGNSVTVPVVEAIGKAIMEYEMREEI